METPHRSTPAALPAVLLALACSCTTPNPDFNPPADGPLLLAPHLPLDGARASDSGTAPQQPKPKPDATTPKPPPQSSPGLGTLCKVKADCPQGELCLFMEQDATSGICLRTCSNADKPCPVPEPKYVSGCATYWNSDVGQVQVCAIFCRLNYQELPCPNNTDYKCKPYGPGMSACIPK